MAEGPPIFFKGPGRGLPGEEEKTVRATKALRRAVQPIAAQEGGVAAMNALISLWLDMSLNVVGQAATEEGLRLLRRDVPRFAAAVRAAKAAGPDPRLYDPRLSDPRLSDPAGGGSLAAAPEARMNDAGGRKIGRLWAWIATEDDGGEGLPAVALGDTLLPLVGADRERIESFRDDVRALQRRAGLPMRLVCFENLVEIERLTDA